MWGSLYFFRACYFVFPKSANKNKRQIGKREKMIIPVMTKSSGWWPDRRPSLMRETNRLINGQTNILSIFNELLTLFKSLCHKTSVYDVHPPTSFIIPYEKHSHRILIFFFGIGQFSLRWKMKISQFWKREETRVRLIGTIRNSSRWTAMQSSSGKKEVIFSYVMACPKSRNVC